MSDEDKKQLLQGMFNGAQLTNVQVIGVVESGAKVVYQERAAAAPMGAELDRGGLARAMKAVQCHMWAASAYAVLFCECRDHWGYPNNMAQFERDVESIVEEQSLDYHCKAGTLSDAFRHNPYLEKSVERWPECGAKERSLLLLQKFQEELNK